MQTSYIIFSFIYSFLLRSQIFLQSVEVVLSGKPEQITQTTIDLWKDVEEWFNSSKLCQSTVEPSLNVRLSLSVCFAVWKNRHMRTVTNYFIVNLSFADVMVTIICLPASLVVDITETWFFGNTLCKVVPYLQVIHYWVDRQIFPLFFFFCCDIFLLRQCAWTSAKVCMYISINSHVLPSEWLFMFMSFIVTTTYNH